MEWHGIEWNGIRIYAKFPSLKIMEEICKASSSVHQKMTLILGTIS